MTARALDPYGEQRRAYRGITPRNGKLNPR